MKRLFLILSVILITGGVAWSYDTSLVDLEPPTELDTGLFELEINHRFYDSVGGEFIGLKGGADVGIGFRILPWKKLEVGLDYTFRESELSVDLAYNWFITNIFLRTRFAVKYFTYMDTLLQRAHGAFISISLQNEPLWERVYFSVQTGYDTYNQQLGLGIGLNVEIFPLLSVFGEFFSCLPHTNTGTFHAGLKINTPGHHFKLIVGNTYMNGIRQMIQGTTDPEIRFGFIIERKLDLWGLLGV